MKKILLISKDAVSKNYLPTYNNGFWKTPNIDALAQNGTIYNRHYTVAASTAMAFYSMVTGQYCFETKCRNYGDERDFSGNTIFDKFKNDGFECYLIWDKTYTSFANSHLKVIQGKTNIISLDIIPSLPPHKKGFFDDLTFDDNASESALLQIKNTFEELSKKKENAFIWIHLPHVLAGRNSYCSDIDLFDVVVGYGRSLFGDNSIFVSADHGNMDGKNGKFSYGFDVDEPAICIPLIGPRVSNLKTIDFPTSNLYLYDILNGSVNKEEFVICDTAYYCQPKRKIAIIKGNYKLVYTKEKKRFQLFDLVWDPNEKYNLFYPEFYDPDRLSWFSLNQRFFYPHWDEAFKAKADLINKFNSVWRKGGFFIETKNRLVFLLKILYLKLTKNKRAKSFKNVPK